ncbi:hypothetical protein ABIC28_002048 [Rhodococcus sp. PvR044]|uniref:hypothetical protein n=1 Tax=Rhodococcus sp. PvR044 TaxID=3156402 RepID=UPI0033951026
MNGEAFWTPAACTVASVPLGIYTSDEFSDHQTNLRFLWLVIGLALIAFAIYASFAKRTTEARQAQAKAEAEEKDPWRLENFVQFFETPVIQLAAESFACWVECIPRHNLRELRMEIMAAVANSVGRSGSLGTRANLFEFDTDIAPVELVSTEYFKGRGNRSVSSFRPSDPTFRATLSNKPRFEPIVGNGYEYETYMTMPIVAGPNMFYGTLTVDALKSGELNEEQDLPIMRYWAALLAVTYALEGFKPVDGHLGSPN